MLQNTEDVKDIKIPIKIVTFIVVVMFAINAAFFVGVQQANMNNKIENNRRDIDAIIKGDSVQDDKIQSIYHMITKYASSIEIAKNDLNTIKENVKEIKGKLK